MIFILFPLFENFNALVYKFNKTYYILCLSVQIFKFFSTLEIIKLGLGFLDGKLIYS